MPLITELPRISDVLMFEDGEEVNYVRDQITLVSGTPACAVGQILGKITSTGKYTQLAPAAADGSQLAAGICVLPANATAADALSVAVTRGPAVLKASGIIYTAGMTGGQKTTAGTQLTTLGITTRSDFGV
jgi:hypothetical protein